MSAHEHNVKKVVLKNGAEGLLIHVPNATVMAMTFNFRAGYFLMEDAKWETPHIMEHMSFGANKNYKKGRLFEADFQKNGAYNNAYTNDYHVWYETECADFEWDRILDLMILAVSEPLYLEEEFNAECGNVHDELIGRSNNRGQMLSIELARSHGFRTFQFLDRAEMMKAVTLEDIRDHYNKTHTCSNLRFIIAGNLDGREDIIRAKMESMHLRKGEGRIELPDEYAKMVTKPLLMKNIDVPNVFFDITTYATDTFSDIDWMASGMTNNMLTGTLFSKILGEAREKGLVYGLSSSFMQTKKQVGWWLAGQAQQQNLPKVLEIATREIKAAANGKLAKNDLEAAKAFALGGFQRGAQTVYGVASGYAGRYFFEDKVDDYFSIPDRINKVTAKDMSEALRRAFTNGAWGIGMLGTADLKLLNESKKIIEPLWQR